MEGSTSRCTTYGICGLICLFPFQGVLDDGDLTLDNFDVVDEKTSLLKAEGGYRMGSLGSLTMSLQPPPSQLSRPASAQQLSQPASGVPGAVPGGAPGNPGAPASTPGAGGALDGKQDPLAGRDANSETMPQLIAHTTAATDKKLHGELCCIAFFYSKEGCVSRDPEEGSGLPESCRLMIQDLLTCLYYAQTSFKIFHGVLSKSHPRHIQTFNTKNLIFTMNDWIFSFYFISFLFLFISNLCQGPFPIHGARTIYNTCTWCQYMVQADIICKVQSH